MKKNKINLKKESFQILTAVLASMIVIITIWGIFFFPSQENKKNSSGFIKFARELTSALTIFQDPKAQEPEQIDINDLRERVFGDKIER